MKETHKKYSTNFDYKSKNNYVTGLNPVQRAVGLIWPSSPGGVLEVYMTGGSDGASYCKPKKYTQAWNFGPKKIPGIKISNPKKYKT